MMIGYVHIAVKAILETEQPEFTSVALCVDKEEIGSKGNTGMHSKFLKILWLN